MSTRPPDSTVNVNLPRRGSSTGIASLVLGVVAFLICWIPILGLLGVPLSGLGLLLGVIGIVVALTRQGASVGLPIAGTVASGVALFVALVVNTAIFTSVQAVSQAVSQRQSQAQATNQQSVLAADGADGAPTDATPAADPSEPPEEPEMTWAPATAPVRQDDVQVEVTGVRVGYIRVRDGWDSSVGESREPLLEVRLSLTNLSATRKLTYGGWAADRLSFGSDDTARLHDNYDNPYKKVGFGSLSEVVGQVDNSESIYPGKSLTDVLVFEAPVATVEQLHLELPAKAFGGTGMIRLRIPAEMIEWSIEEEGPAGDAVP